MGFQDHPWTTTPETPPDWGGNNEFAMSGDEGHADAQPDSVRDDPMVSSSAQDARVRGVSGRRVSGESGSARPASSTMTLKDNPDATPREVVKENPNADTKEETKRRRDRANSLPERKNANKIRAEDIMPFVLAKGKRCNVKVDLSYTF